MKVKPYYSAQESGKGTRVYHTHNDCQSGRDILPNQKQSGTGGFRLCKHCKAKG